MHIISHYPRDSFDRKWEELAYPVALESIRAMFSSSGLGALEAIDNGIIDFESQLETELFDEGRLGLLPPLSEKQFERQLTLMVEQAYGADFDPQMGGFFKRLKRSFKRVVRTVKKVVRKVGKVVKKVAPYAAMGAAIYFGGPMALGAVKGLISRYQAAKAAGRVPEVPQVVYEQAKATLQRAMQGGTLPISPPAGMSQAEVMNKLMQQQMAQQQMMMQSAAAQALATQRAQAELRSWQSQPAARPAMAQAGMFGNINPQTIMMMLPLLLVPLLMGRR